MKKVMAKNTGGYDPSRQDYTGMMHVQCINDDCAAYLVWPEKRGTPDYYVECPDCGSKLKIDWPIK